ncbi:hypothetical protein [Roseibium sp. RKSG952]|uniref:type IV toxin-antitoxin system AbiEi family antitoxin domain-containing protein n=1 Tax=Roseibium sp. RKSG952 TaxID=2529384 RepID=UPI0012BB5F05|nr:hypothetical protein [Roseibium sp. RKSG952]MTH94717.1 hypothetical protein [Roseibium sp. RKSG952]
MKNRIYNTGNVRSPKGLKAMQRLARAGRPMRSSEIGVPSFVMRRLLAAQLVENPARGIYALPSEALGDENDHWDQLATITKLRPNAVFVLDTAAAFHGMTQNMTGHVSVALPASNSPIKSETLNGLSIVTHRMRNNDALTVGVETYLIQGVEVNITSKARTLVDLVRYAGHGTVRGGHVLVDAETELDAFMRFYGTMTDVDRKELRKLSRQFGIKDLIADRLRLLDNSPLEAANYFV